MENSDVKWHVLPVLLGAYGNAAVYLIIVTWPEIDG